VCRVKSLAVVKIGGSRAHLLTNANCTELEAEFVSFLNEFSFHFSPDYDFSHTLQRWATLPEPRQLDRRFFWNSFAAERFVSKGFSSFVLVVCDSFVGVVEDDVVQYVLISRRSKRRQGARFLVRGVDLLGNVANFVETEQIVSAARASGRTLSASFVQIRGSMPVCWNQRGESKELMPLPKLPLAPFAWQGFVEHCRELKKLYGMITALCLVDKVGKKEEFFLF
jgi:hypothetical protein